MNAVEYQEPHRFLAGFLALVVHLLFFVFLYFGVHWQSQPHADFSAEIWNSLPDDVQPAPQPAPPPPVKAEPPPPARVVAPVLPPVKADIEMSEKKSKPIVATQPKKDDTQAKAAKVRQEAQAKVLAESEAETRALQTYDDKQRALQQHLQAERQRIKKENDEAAAAAQDAQIATYQDRIRNKIRRRMLAVAGVPATVEAIFNVTLLPDGSLLDDPALAKSSGYPAYDDAAERAIISAQPLPIPADPVLQRQFRQLTLSIKPQESE